MAVLCLTIYISACPNRCKQTDRADTGTSDKESRPGGGQSSYSCGNLLICYCTRYVVSDIAEVHTYVGRGFLCLFVLGAGSSLTRLSQSGYTHRTQVLKTLGFLPIIGPRQLKCVEMERALAGVALHLHTCSQCSATRAVRRIHLPVSSAQHRPAEVDDLTIY